MRPDSYFMMSEKAIFSFCKERGCCNACCLRYLGLKYPLAYEKVQEYVSKYQDNDIEEDKKNIAAETTNGSESPPQKRHKSFICITCLGVLQEDTWLQCFTMAKETLDKKCYECTTFACALSSPIAALLRENVLSLMIADHFSDYDKAILTPLKEAWKWSFATRLATHINKTLDSGSVSPLLITLTMEYPDDLQELEILKILSPALFESRSKEKKRFSVEFTRRSVEQALEGITLDKVKSISGWESGLKDVNAPARCVSVVCTHAPGYLAGRYIKLSRTLPQTPWLVGGVRMMPSSVQETIFDPIAKLYGMSPEEAEHRLKLVSAGREDVDVRCLGEGRPFAVEVTDPRRVLSPSELQSACDQISSSKLVLVKTLVHINKEQLAELKKGEQTKSKTYEALCIKLSHSEDDARAATNGQASSDLPLAVTVTQKDIENINRYRNTSPSDEARVSILQKTPIRVLHRRPLLTRTRRILELSAGAVPEYPQLFVVRVRTDAGTYVKEWVHGELGRTRPALGDALDGAAVDILALDVASVDLPWPPTQ